MPRPPRPTARNVGRDIPARSARSVAERPRRRRFWVGTKEGVAPAKVARELAAFEARLQRIVAALDARCPTGTKLDADGLAAVIDLGAWAHSEWVRIHPFGNVNGRTARIWANYLFMRYGLPPVVRLRPRPDGGYGPAGAAANGWRLASNRQSIPKALI